MDWLQAITLALVQGITEFLPISSSAHLVITSRLMGWSDQGLLFDLGLHVGTLAAVVVFFSRTLYGYTASCVRLCASYVGLGMQFPIQKHDHHSYREIVLLLIASIPVAIAGTIFASLIDAHLRTLLVIFIANTFFALVLAFADTYSRRRNRLRLLRPMQEMQLWQALIIGVAQSLAIIPGTSRSGVTLSCALLFGFDRHPAAKFSFLLAIPVIGGGGALALLDLVDTNTPPNVAVLLVAMCIAFVMALACIGLLMRLVTHASLAIFVWYRLALSFGLLFLL